MANYNVLFPVLITGIDRSTTFTENSTWIPSPTAGATTNITAPLHITVAEKVNQTESITYSLLQVWLSTNASWTLGQGGPNGDVPLTFTTLPPTGPTVATTSDTSTSPITSPTSSITSPTSSDGGSNSMASRTSSVGPGPTSSEASIHNGITSGAAAGIGIGSAAAGAILAFLLAFLLMRRKSSGSKGHSGPGQLRSTPSAESSSGFDKTPAIVMSSLPSKGIDSVSPLLPPPTQTSELVKTFSTLSTMIQNHAYSYFSEGPKGNVSAAHDINSGHVNMILGPGAPVEPKTVLELLNSSQRVVAVRLLLGWAILSNIEPHSDANLSLLPPEFFSCLRTFGEDLSTDPTLLSKWRHLTGVLFDSTYGSKPPNVRFLNRENLAKVVGLLDEVFAPLESLVKAPNRRNNLEEIVKLGAESGYTLLTQPTGWKFEWQSAHANPGNALVVFPDLVQVEDDIGRALDPPRSYNTIQVVKTV